ncbi:MAG: phospho-N-acetylmuramoyl-pentapeptide-transferase [Clostridiales bacterium]|nr:phospho-N-acetylmuramoyl-pentapeptide-transferase [Clostridiales bacterium]
MMREAGAAILSFGLMLLIMPRLIPFLKRLKFGQTIYQLGPQSHQAKQGTPNMGGLAIALAVVVGSVAAVLCFGGADRLAALLSVSLGSLLIGFIDDFVKDVRKHHEGLKPRHKILSQFVVGIVFSIYCAKALGTAVLVPFTGRLWDLGVFYVPLMVLMIMFITNSANLQDGVDGLLSSVAAIGAAALGIMAMILQAEANGAVSVGMFALVGACAGFLVFNRHPARIFMGDTGSMFIGGLFAGAAMLLRVQFWLLLLCFTMIMSSVSVIMQRIYFKATGGKRIFRMSPLHHHFELGGMTENQVVCMYSLVTCVLAALAVLVLELTTGIFLAC